MASQKVTREMAIEALRLFAEAGDPANLDINDPKVVAAYELVNAWYEQSLEQADQSGIDWAGLEVEVLRTTIEIDAEVPRLRCT